MSLRPFLPQTENHQQINDLPWNDLIDHVMPALKPNSWKVLCFILRKTLGWSKEADRLSYSQIINGITDTKSSDRTIFNALGELIEGGYILVTNPGKEKSALIYAPNPDFEIKSASKTVADEKETTPKMLADAIQSASKTVADEPNVKESASKTVDTIDHVLLLENTPTFQILYNRWIDNLGDLKPREGELLGDYYDECPNWVSEVMDIVIGAKPDNPWQYFVKIINKWVKHGKPEEPGVQPNPPPVASKNGLSKQVDLDLLQSLQRQAKGI